MRNIGKLQKSLPLFNAVAVDCSFCCCFVSTKTDVGKPLTSTVADNKIEKITPTLYFKSHAILLNTEIKIMYSNRRDLFSFSMNRWREQNIFHFKFVVLFHINGAEIHNKNATFRETCWFSTSTTIKAISHTLCMYRLNQTSWTVSCFFSPLYQFRFPNMFQLLRFIFDWGHGQFSSHIYLRCSDAFWQIIVNN